MINIYIDESGSMTPKSEEYKQPFFIVSLIIVKDEKKLKRNLKRFVSNNLHTLKKIDRENKMFNNGIFRELKGNVFNSALKRKFVNSIIKDSSFEVYYIKLLNSKAKAQMFENKARTFNYLLKLFFQHNIRNGNLKDCEYFLQIDERNIKTQSKNTLVDYLNTELVLSDDLLSQSLKVRYFDSANNKFIQVADIFANLYYSHCITNGYADVLNNLIEKGILKEIFIFPKNVSKNIDK